MQFMDLVNTENPPFNREPSVSMSHEGLDFVFEDLLGPLPKIEASNNSNNKPSNSNQQSPIQNQTIEELFDDIFAASILTDDEEDESEGYNPNSTSFIMPNEDNDDHDNDNTDVLDSILQDLDEKTKEMDKKANKNEKKKQKKRKKKHATNKAKAVQVKVCTHAIDENEKLRKWEFDANVRRNIRVLLSTLHLALPPRLEHQWKVVKMSELLNDAKVKKQYFKAIRITHPDKCIGRGDTTETKMICNYIFQALEEANAKHIKD